MENSKLQRLFEDFAYEYNRFQWTELLDMGERLHQAVLHKARAGVLGQPCLFRDHDVVPELDGIGYPFKRAENAHYEGFLDSWVVGEEYLSKSDLKKMMAKALTLEQIDAMRKFARSTNCQIPQIYVKL